MKEKTLGGSKSLSSCGKMVRREIKKTLIRTLKTGRRTKLVRNTLVLELSLAKVVLDMFISLKS